MQVLHLTPELPARVGVSGGATRQLHLLSGLVERGHDVAVIAPVSAAQKEAARSLGAAGVTLHAVRRPRFRVREAVFASIRDPRLLPALGTRPVLAWQMSVFWAAMRPVVERLLHSRQFDVVSVEHDGAAAWAADLPAELPRVLTLQNLSWLYYRSRAAAAAGARARLLQVEAKRWWDFDLDQLRRYDMLIAVSEDDRREAASATSLPVALVPNGVSTEDFVPGGDARDPATLLFTGTMNHPPNSEGIRWFAGHVWPLVVSRRPDARLLVVGRDPSAAVRSLSGDARIAVTGAVDDFRPYLQRATAVIVPLRSGGGTRLKVLEALASGCAIVSTRVGAEGIVAAAGRDLLVEDEPEAFAAATLRLLDDAELRARVETAAQRAAARYDWRLIAESLERALESALGVSGRGGSG